MAFRQLPVRTLFRLASLALAISIATPWLIHPSTSASENFLDGTRGLFLGTALGLFILVARRGGFRVSGGPGRS